MASNVEIMIDFVLIGPGTSKLENFKKIRSIQEIEWKI